MQQLNKKKAMFTKLRDSLLKECSICEHTGWKDDKMCSCLSKVEYYMSLDEAGIDKEYWDASFEAFKGDQVAKHIVEKYISKIDVAYDEGLGIVFWGNHGTGKTMLSTIILKKAKDTGKSIQFITMAELLDIMRKKIDRPELEKFYDESIKNIDFLCIDNLGSEYSVKRANVSYAVAEFDVLSRYRKRNMLPTILTTNETPETFKNLYSSAISSLYSGCSAFIEVAGADYREISNRFDELMK